MINIYCTLISLISKRYGVNEFEDKCFCCFEISMIVVSLFINEHIEFPYDYLIYFLFPVIDVVTFSAVIK